MYFPNIDILFASCNSEKWIEPCFTAISKLDYPLDKLKIIVYDNFSEDGTVEKLNTVLKQLSLNHSIIEGKTNVGFGVANNLAAAQGEAPYIFCLNIDTEIEKDSLHDWVQYLDKYDQEGVGAWEFKQLPFEHPKIYNPATLTTSWCSAAALIIKRTVFDELKGFDPKIFMYCEDVDISWRIRAKGYSLKYLHFCKVVHHTYTNHYGNEIKILSGVINNILLRYRFGSFWDILKGYYQFAVVLRKSLKGYRKAGINYFLKHFFKIPYFLKTRVHFPEKKFYYWDYEVHRYGAELKKIQHLKNNDTLVSIIIRTHKKPEFLKQAIQSVVYQTYKNWELIIVEDFGNTGAEIVAQFNDDRIRYISSTHHIGRCAVGNIGLEETKGKYVNFLDDDDMFYNDHIESLLNYAVLTEADGVYGLAYESQCEIISEKPIHYVERELLLPIFTEFSRLTLATMNFLPIQAVLFKRELYEKHGGFDLSLDFLEDWDLWYRYGVNSDFRLCPKATSIYKTPFHSQIRNDRQLLLDKNNQRIREKHQNQNIELFGYPPEKHVGMQNLYFSSRLNLKSFFSMKKERMSGKKKIIVYPISLVLKGLEKVKFRL